MMLLSTVCLPKLLVVDKLQYLFKNVDGLILHFRSHMSIYLKCLLYIFMTKYSGGGGGADLDVVTAGKPDVLAGKVIVDKDGEPLTGTMVNRGAVSQALGVNGTYTIPEGNGSGKVTQNIPIQGADVSGTDRAWATNVSCWEGVACLGVRNAHYLNGVNWIQGNIPNFYAGNIKKGVNIGGVIGAW